MVVDRKPIAFNLNDDGYVPDNISELSDDFFELTSSEVTSLYKELTNHRQELDERPLKTSAIRDMENAVKVNKFLTRYKYCVIRIQFPDRSVLQGVFEPQELFSEVILFVKSNLINPKQDFYLFTTPPKVVPKNTVNLLDLGYGSATKLYFGSPKPAKPPFIKPQLFVEVVEAKLSAVKAREERGEEIKENSDDLPGPSQPRAPTPPPKQPAKRPTKSEGKIPKWFRPQ